MYIIRFDGSTISLVTSGILSGALLNTVATTINVNGIDYAVFISGYNIDFVTLITNNKGKKEVSLVSGEIPANRDYAAVTTINVNGIDYAVFISYLKYVDIFTLITNSDGEKEVSLVASAEKLSVASGF